ncbi:MAG: hypothetical protein U0U70_09995 [Chitinophagaceae bacterium]
MFGGELEQAPAQGAETGLLAGRPAPPSFDAFRLWKMISPNNIYIICLPVLLFSFFAFTGHGLYRTALSTSLIASVPVGISEAGKYKSAIAYLGDVLTTTARMLSKCHELDSELHV